MTAHLSVMTTNSCHNMQHMLHSILSSSPSFPQSLFFTLPISYADTMKLVCYSIPRIREITDTCFHTCPYSIPVCPQTLWTLPWRTPSWTIPPPGICWTGQSCQSRTWLIKTPYHHHLKYNHYWTQEWWVGCLHRQNKCVQRISQLKYHLTQCKLLCSVFAFNEASYLHVVNKTPWDKQ